MTNSFFLGQVMGLYLVIMALFLLVKRSSIFTIKESMQRSPALMLISGVISLVLGLLVVLSHNVWVLNWPVIITLLGYVMIIAAIMRLFFAEKAFAFFDNITKSNCVSIWAIVMLILGLWLTLASFNLV